MDNSIRLVGWPIRIAALASHHKHDTKSYYNCVKHELFHFRPMSPLSLLLDERSPIQCVVDSILAPHGLIPPLDL